MSSLDQIRSFRRLGDRIGTAGQPAESDFVAIQAHGFEAVINLALPTSDNAIPHEGSVVTRLGMAYVHIPVDFGAPKERDFETFRGAMKAFGDRKVFVHCAANMRVSAFMYLYRVLEEGLSRAEAERDLHSIWKPDPTWQSFIDRQLR